MVAGKSKGLRNSNNRSHCAVMILVFMFCRYAVVFRALVVFFFLEFI